MFRKSGAIMLAILYTTTVLGFALNLHFCGSKIASVNITAPTKAKADITCGMKMKCCKNQHVTVKVKDSHQVQQTSVLAKVFAIDLSKIPFCAEYIFSAQKALIEKLLDRGPPADEGADEKVPTFIKNRNLRI